MTVTSFHHLARYCDSFFSDPDPCLNVSQLKLGFLGLTFPECLPGLWKSPVQRESVQPSGEQSHEHLHLWNVFIDER